ncbi:hypothetical protein HDU93_007926, partial [Gonapodya sp. JEL0774]
TALVAAKSISFSSALRLVRARGLAMSRCVGQLPVESHVMVAVVVHLSPEVENDDRSHATDADERAEEAESKLREIEECLAGEEVQQALESGEVVEISNINSL